MDMDLHKRLQDAIHRGQRLADEKANPAGDGWTPEKLKNLHNQFRLELSSHIENVMRQVVDQIPGFNLETLFGEKGWGAAIHRDDLFLTKKQRESHYSRLEVVVRPINDYAILDLASKATIRNREVWNRNFFHPVTEAEIENFREQINRWAVQFVEQYSAS